MDGGFQLGNGVTGSNRLVQLADNGTVYYNRCKMKTNGWGVFSIDGCDVCARIYVKDCDVDLSGPRANGLRRFLYRRPQYRPFRSEPCAC